MTQRYKTPHVGPGGRHCPCCFPPPGDITRRARFKRAARLDNQEALQEGIEEYLSADEWDELE